MTIAYFRPVWEHFIPASITEGQGVNITLPISIKATCILDSGKTSIPLDPQDSPHVIAVTRDGIPVAFDIQDDILEIPSNDSISIIEITRASSIAITHIMGEMPPGLVINGTHIKGIVTNVPYPGPTTYRFGLRAAADGKIGDVRVSLVANPVDEQLTWNPDTLPVVSVNAAIMSRPFYSFGALSRGREIEFGVDMLNPDATPVEVLARAPSGIVPSSTSFGSLPLGLTLTNSPTTIRGFIPAEALAGDYFVELYVDEALSPAAIVVHFEIPQDSFDSFTVVNRLTWNSTSNIGDIVEGLPCFLRVSATTESSNSITYVLAEGSRPLPTGMRLMPSGLITGIAPHVAGDKSYSFTIKASSGVLVAVKTFTFTILNSFLDPHMTASLPLTGDQRIAFRSYYNQLPVEKRYRADDTLFHNQARVMLLRGFNQGPVVGLSHDIEFRATMGPFMVATAKIAGAPLFDVIYRPFYTPMDKSGDYAPGQDIIPTPVTNPHDPTQFIVEGGFTNLRKNIAEVMGLASTINHLGQNGGELLDLWMTDYVPAAIVGFVEAGSGGDIIETMTYGALPVGTEVAFDRMEVDNGLGAYLYFFGGENSPTKIVYANPSAPGSPMVNGIPFSSNQTFREEPVLTWTATEPNQTYVVRVLSSEGLLSEHFIDTPYYKYTLAQQAVDGDPGFTRFEVSSIRSLQESTPVAVNVPLRKGWGHCWSLDYGSA